MGQSPPETGPSGGQSLHPAWGVDEARLQWRGGGLGPLSAPSTEAASLERGRGGPVSSGPAGDPSSIHGQSPKLFPESSDRENLLTTTNALATAP